MEVPLSENRWKVFFFATALFGCHFVTFAIFSYQIINVEFMLKSGVFGE
jgi:hypothetical protein